MFPAVSMEEPVFLSSYVISMEESVSFSFCVCVSFMDLAWILVEYIDTQIASSLSDGGLDVQ